MKMRLFSWFGFWLFALCSLPVTTAKMSTQQLKTFSSLLVLIPLPQLTGQSNLICSPQPIVALAGDDVILPCRLDPPTSASSRTVEWTRPGLDPEYVHVHQDGRLVHQSQNPLYHYRTALFVDQLINGNVSLNLFRVKISDAGKYKCFLPSLRKEASIQITVGAVSSPVITLAGIDRDKGGVVLQCESAGWHPEPEVLWLDGEGKLLSAGPTETVRGPDDLYTVSSRVTVEKRHSNSFTCRVQQRSINQTTETHIQVPDDFFKVQSSPSSTITGLAVSLAAVSIMLILLLVFFVCKQRNNRTKTKRSPSDERDTGPSKNPSGEEMESLKGEEEKKRNSATDSAWWPLVSRRRFREEKRRREESENKFEGNQAETIKQLQVQTQLKDRAQSEVQTLKNQLETKIRELQEEKTKNTNLEKEVKTLKQDIQMKDTQLQEEKKTNTNLEKEVKTLKQDIQMKDTQLQEEKKTNTNLEKEVKTLKQDIKMKDTQLQEEKKTNTNLEKEVKTLKQDIQMKDTQVSARDSGSDSGSGSSTEPPQSDGSWYSRFYS
ncbi:butyrophilin subfamily 2 member A1-like isoform X3 [Epinephelus fuscoguttatus]|uniref:butyrophilin subfamily 2 member A1-like isoform X3 n=1 Tax=Epinephelus fuscoguttatus TaxID=293821 RepID=UPI0020D1840A|nr:butyrophilin subfamily 2 member A1-like isoform X3 [Epinephelus fuscoguttatus]